MSSPLLRPGSYPSLQGYVQSGDPMLVSPLIHFTPLPLSAFLHTWRDLPGVSSWIIRIIQFSYTLQFDRNPPRFNGVFLTAVNSANEASVLQQEVSSLLLKGAKEDISSLDLHRGFFSRYFLVPKKNRGLRPILDLRRLNYSLHRGKFRMLTLKSILSQVQERDWFIMVDLKDAYFYIQVVQRHRKLFRFAFGGKAYQYKVLPYGLALAPRTFTKCLDAALAPLRLQGIRILNYLDDWLILASSTEQVIHHRDSLLLHLCALGLWLNGQKSVLNPAQQTIFWGVCLDSTSMQARLAHARVESIPSCSACFKLGRPFAY